MRSPLRFLPFEVRSPRAVDGPVAAFRCGEVVEVVLECPDPDTRKRLVDFFAGVAFGLEGRVLVLGPNRSAPPPRHRRGAGLVAVRAGGLGAPRRAGRHRPTHGPVVRLIGSVDSPPPIRGVSSCAGGGPTPPAPALVSLHSVPPSWRPHNV